MSRIPPDVINEIDLRSGFGCELGADCIWPPSEGRFLEYHHRQARAMGGSKRPLDVAANLLHLHRGCHAYVHAHPEWSRERGYIVSQYAETPA